MAASVSTGRGPLQPQVRRLAVAYKILHITERVKAVIWAGSARRDVRAFPKDVRRRAGYELYRVQQGLDPTDWKPIPSVGAGVREIRIHMDQEHRVIYVAKFDEGIYVLHAFEKKTRRTRREDLTTAGKRLRDVVRDRERTKMSGIRR